MEQDTRPLLSSPSDSAHAQAEQAIRQWHQQHQQAWHKLTSLAWQDARVHYARAYEWAETLLQQSPCKSCAIKAYVRTLVEYGLVMRKLEQMPATSAVLSQQLALSGLRTIACHSLEALLGQARARQLLAPLADIQRATPVQIDQWLGRLLLSDASTAMAH